MRNVIKLLFILILFTWRNELEGATTSPSQIVPKVFEEIEKEKIKKLDKENILKDLNKIDSDDQKPNEIEVVVESIVIIAPKNLQKIIVFDKYKKELVGKKKNIDDLNGVSRKMTQEFGLNNFPLVRVILPKQNLKADGATIFFKVIDGFIEKIDFEKIPKAQRKNVLRYLRPLKNKKQISNSLLERRLLLAGQSAGLKLNTAFTAGSSEGATILVIEAKHKLLSGGVQFNNTQSEELGRQLGILQTTINSPIGFGESLTMYGLARPTIKGMKGTGNDVSIRGGGLSFSYPLGDNGLKASLSYSESMTRPGGVIASLGIESNLKSGSLGLTYPLRLRADSTWSL